MIPRSRGQKRARGGIGIELQRAHRTLMTFQNIEKTTCLKIPNVDLRVRVKGGVSARGVGEGKNGDSEEINRENTQ